MTIELAITDDTPAQEAAQALSEEQILDCFLGTPMQGSYRDYLVNAGRAIEQKARCVQPDGPSDDADPITRCPWCGARGPNFDESPMPSDYCGHDPALVRTAEATA